MKKLLTLLGSFAITASAGSMAVACTNYDKKQDGNSILINFLNSLNGKANIDASDVLWKLVNENGPKNRETFALDFLKTINASILINSEKNFGENGEIKLNNSSAFISAGLASSLSDKWNTLNKAVDLKIQREKDKYKKDNGKKWWDKWCEMLVGKYSVYQDKVKDMDVDLLEGKYKSDILLTDSSNNVTKALLDILLNTDQLGVTWITVEQVKRKLATLKSVKDDKDKLLYAAKSDVKALQQIINSTKESGEWVKSSVNDQSTDDEISAKVDEALKIEESNIKYDVPTDINELVTGGADTRAGMLSNSQQFFLNKYYNAKAPIAISEITIAFSDNKTFDDGILPSDFEGDNEVNSKQTWTLLKQIITDKTSWSEIMAKGSTTHSKATVKHYDNLLTLTNTTDFTPTLSSIVYDYILGERYKTDVTRADENDKVKVPEWTTKTDIEKEYKKEDFGKLITALNRTGSFDKTSNNLYRKLSDGDKDKLVYIDSSGIHIVSIDGFNELVESTTNTPNKDAKKIIDDTKNGIDKETQKSLNDFKEFNKLTTQEKIYDFWRKTDSEDRYFKKLNSTVTNPYLKFLVNNSLLKGVKGSPVGFDIMAEVKAWATISSSSEKEFYWVTMVYDYFQTMTSKQEDKLTEDKSFIEQFVIFGPDGNNEKAQAIAKKIGDWTIGAIKSMKIVVTNNPSWVFVDAYKKMIEELDTKTNIGYPKEIVKNDIFNSDKLAEEINKVWWHAVDKKGAQSVQTFKTNAFDYSLSIYDLNSIAYNYKKNNGGIK